VDGQEELATNADVDLFAPTGLDIDNWLDAAVSADMKYATLTTKHHSGFALWPTAHHVGANPPYSVAETEWYVNNGQIDIVGQFVTKCRARNINPCFYFSMWDLTYEARAGTDETTDAVGYLAMIETQLEELLTNYGAITAIWLDGWWHLGYDEIPYATIRDFIHTLQPTCLVINNGHSFPSGVSQIDVYETPTADGSIPAGNTRYAEEADTIIPGSWGWQESLTYSDATLVPATTILAAIANANNNYGTYLLNVPPTSAGVLPPAVVTRLAELGT
jgi:alpha-L-fucosidase